MPHETAPRRHKCCGAQSDAPKAEKDDDDVPERTAIKKERKIQIVKSTIQPPVQAAVTILFRDRPMLRIKIDPGALRIRVTNAQNRQGSQAILVVVVPIVLLQP